MAYAAAMQMMARLTASAEALAALGARMRADAEGIPLDPAIESALDGVLVELGIELAALQPAERSTVALFARAFLRQAVDLIDHPECSPGWAYEDDVVLLSLGRGSAAIADAMAEVSVLDDALSRPGAILLDVGAGVAALSVSLCARWPGLRVVGLEPWPPALAHARRTIAGYEDRIELREQRVEELTDARSYDVVWLSTPFIAPEILPVALLRVFDALKPGGHVIFGMYAGPPDPLSQRLVDLRTTRSGGAVATEAEATAALTAAGFESAREVERVWAAPVRLVVGTRG
ncbi:class I SAM-dependent methyltransferase [Solirubrobacter ginsenosidimutans]|uniref:Class I SAM-dependent methyltransferase n=1 Tax=Solirubrobacter ginsenosidimutans TaxID=490573 RepID=A0A9X3MU70_9ACTN|nr:class I SAM-dependent methyltransferase [Solirubrobacter ginsenosidimutans]MDA0163101.1 class I SAM-dependent methyltransferase [Solirubrobacter ginsenosidimutans]